MSAEALGEEFHARLQSDDLVLIEGLHPCLAFGLVRERDEQVPINELLVEDEAQYVFLAQFLLLYFIQWLEDEVVERLELLGLILSTGEVKQTAVSEAQEALLPATSEHAAITLLEDDSSLEALDHGVIHDGVGVLRVIK